MRDYGSVGGECVLVGGKTLAARRTPMPRYRGTLSRDVGAFSSFVYTCARRFTRPERRARSFRPPTAAHRSPPPSANPYTLSEPKFSQILSNVFDWTNIYIYILKNVHVRIKNYPIISKRKRKRSLDSSFISYTISFRLCWFF